MMLVLPREDWRVKRGACRLRRRTVAWRLRVF